VKKAADAVGEFGEFLRSHMTAPSQA
jgi:hypothetical protein